MNLTKSTLLWIVAVGAYSYLFYDQELGINTLVFAPIILLLLWLDRPVLFKMKHFQWAAVLFMASAVAIAWHSYPWAILSHFIAGCALMGCRYEPQSSVIMSFFNGFFGALLIGFTAKTLRWSKELKSKQQPKNSFLRWRKISLLIMPLLVTLFFYWLYYLANPDFALHLSWFEGEYKINTLLIVTILWGMVWTTPLFFSWGIEKLTDNELSLPDTLVRHNTNPQKQKYPTLGLLDENRQGVIMFGMLNILISAFLLLGIWQIFNPSQKGYSEQVHEGFFTVVVSIFLAAILILYFFRGNQNFYSKNHRLKQLAYFWILLNVGLAVFTLFKNSTYVAAYGLTYKRIAVYFGMFLTLMGLGFAYWKIKYLKTNLFLIRANAWILFAVVVFIALIDWDRAIVGFNLRYARHIDFKYLHGLSSSAAPQLVAYDNLMKNTPAHLRPQGYEPYQIPQYFEYAFKESDWRSQNFDQQRLKAFWDEHKH